MSDFFSRVRDGFAALSGRERVLVAVAAALTTVVIAVYAVILPLGRAHDAAHVRHTATIVSAGRVEAGLAMLAQTPDRASGEVTIAQAISDAADQAGIVVEGGPPQAGNSATISVPTAAPGAALAFLEALHEAGFAVGRVTMAPAPDGSVAVTATVQGGAS